MSSKRQHKEILKQRGLVETGNEKFTPQEIEKSSYFDESTIRDLKKEGVEMSDKEADALIDGKSLAVQTELDPT